MRNSDEVCRTADVTFRQLDYWTRLGLLAPEGAGQGSGVRRRWDDQEVAMATLVGRLFRLGCDATCTAEAVAMLRGMPASERWVGNLVLTPDRRVLPGVGTDVALLGGCAWVVDLGTCQAAPMDADDAELASC